MISSLNEIDPWARRLFFSVPMCLQELDLYSAIVSPVEVEKDPLHPPMI